MDIDFHYYATYVAARFAGYPANHATVIASAAQSIDENGRHVLVDDSVGMTTGLTGVPDDFEIRAEPNGPSLHTFRVQMTFQGLGDIGTSATDTVASIWPVYHFLPGNFLPNNIPADRAQPSAQLRAVARSGPPVFLSSRWRPRQFGGSRTSADIAHKFRWLCRPHSPLAIGIVNNATDMIHDPASEVTRHALELYLAGATMHVFIDTWAHQDFVGPASRTINTVTGNPSIGFIPPGGPKTLPVLVGDTPFEEAVTVPLNESKWKGTAQGFNWIAGHGIAFTDIDETRNIYVGHGQVGHWPDHSALVWQYHPGWSSAPITRSNPAAYFDAFVHMVWALYCMRENKQYVPFDTTEQNLGVLCATVGISIDQLRAVYALFTTKRSPWGTEDDPDVPAAISDIWDRDIYAYGQQWRAAIAGPFGLEADPPVMPWMPGKSTWVVDAADAHKSNQALSSAKQARKGNWYSVAQFTALPFFKFNLAAKFHYRFVKQTLINFGELLLGDWPDGAAYADDLAFATQGGSARLADVINTLSTIQRMTTHRDLSEGMTVLLSEIRCVVDGVPTADGQLAKVLEVLRAVETAVDSNADWTYGIREGKDNEISSQMRGIAGADALKAIKKLIATLSALEPPAAPQPGAGGITLPSFSDWKDRSSSFLSSRSGDQELTALDNAYSSLMAHLGPSRRLQLSDRIGMDRADAVVAACAAWLTAGKGARGRRESILALRATLTIFKITVPRSAPQRSDAVGAP